MTRYCVIKKGSQVVFTLRSTPNLSVGGLFAVRNAQGTEIERFTLSTANPSKSIATDNLIDNTMQFEINYCSLSNVTNGTVEVRIEQDGVQCPITKPMYWESESVPRCDASSGNNQLTVSGIVKFNKG